MPDFPEIGCHAVAQYPSSFTLRTPVIVQQYIDGTEQRFRDSQPALRQWRIQLRNLTQKDAEAVRAFFSSVFGSASSFRFRDPWTGAWVDRCWFRSDTLDLDHLADDSFSGEFEIYAED